MTIYKVNHGSSIIEFSNLIDAEFYCNVHSLSIVDIVQEQRTPTIDYYSLVDSALRIKQSQGAELLRQIFVENTLAGISTEQSKELFRNHQDILLCILVGAFPTAYSMILEIQPYGFLTQERLDSWKAMLEQYL